MLNVDIQCEKERYLKYCENPKTIVPIFSQPWWMDALCGRENWGVHLVGDDNNIKASFVYYVCEDAEQNGQVEITRALLTQNNGIIVNYPQNQGVISRQKYDEEIVDEICGYIEHMGISRYDQQYHYCFTNFLPFFWHFYTCSIKYTYVIENTKDMVQVRASYSSKLKNMLRKAQKYSKVIEEIDLHTFYSVNEMSFTRQSIQIPYSFEQFKKLYDACSAHDACKLLAACGEDGQINSVAMLVWDNQSVYYLLNGTNPALKHLQGNCLLIDYAIEFAGLKGLKFDFEGSVIKGVNHAIREYGGTPMQYFRISKSFISD